MQTIRQYLRLQRADLPAIPQRRKKPSSVDLKQSSILHKLNNSKSITGSHRRSKTLEVDHIASKSRQRLQLFINFEQMRMRPMVKYDHCISNLRLAEKLLIVKPSKDTDRSDQKRFYVQQRYYRDQISKGYQYLKNSRYSHSFRKQQ